MRYVIRSIAGLAAFAVFATQSFADTSTAPAAPQLTRADLETWLDGLVPYALQQGDIAGLAVAVVKDGQVLFEKGYGYADVVERTAMDPERTMVRTGSLSKAFTATAVMQLVEQGKLDLDRDVNTYLDFEIPPAFGKPITLRNLLTHTAGFEETAYRRYQPPLTLREHMLMIPDRIFPPGEIPAYSNYSLSLAGYIVQRISGEPIAQYVERHIFQPLGMQHSSFRMTLPDMFAPLEAKTYALASSREPYAPNLVAEMVPTESPAGGLATTAHDMTRFMLAHLQQGGYGEPRLLRADTVAKMHAASFVPIPGAQPVALGLFRADYEGHRAIGHSGDGEGQHAEMKLLLDQNVGIFTVVNSDGAIHGFLPAAFGLRAMLFEQFMARYFPATQVDEPTLATAKEHAQLAAGEYVWSRQQKGDYQEALFLIGRFLALESVIRARDDGTIETTPAMTLEKSGRAQVWREVRPFVWREVGGSAHLLMKVRDGRVQAVWSDAVPSYWINLRVPSASSAGLHVPLLLSATGVLIATALFWPIGAIIRRRYGATLQLAEPQRRAYRWSRLAAVTGALYMLGWLVALAGDLASKVGAEPWIRLIQLMGLLCIAGAGVAAWNAWLTWRGARSAVAGIWSVVLAFALLYLVWFSFAFHLLSVRIN